MEKRQSGNNRRWKTIKCFLLFWFSKNLPHLEEPAPSSWVSDTCSVLSQTERLNLSRFVSPTHQSARTDRRDTCGERRLADVTFLYYLARRTVSHGWFKVEQGRPEGKEGWGRMRRGGEGGCGMACVWLSRDIQLLQPPAGGGSFFPAAPRCCRPSNVCTCWETLPIHQLSAFSHSDGSHPLTCGVGGQEGVGG